MSGTTGKTPALSATFIDNVNALGDAAETMDRLAPVVLADIVPLYNKWTGSPKTLTNQIRKATTGYAKLPIGGSSAAFVLQFFCELSAKREVPIPTEFLREAGLFSAQKKAYDTGADAWRAKFSAVTSQEEWLQVAREVQNPVPQGTESSKSSKTAASKTAAKVTAQIAAVTKSLGKLDSVTQTEAAALVAAAKALLKAAESIKVENLAIEAAPAA